ncbi:MAG TPA: HlyD family secretion protein [Candidatus Acidoferrales bacterium]|nr:HlyD family secretion protein [Candidatus Acidoferrales bacterium]
MIEVDVGLENFDKVPKLPEPPPKRAAGLTWANPLFRRAVYAGGAVVVLAAASLFWHFHFRESTDDAQVDGHIAPISAKISGNVIEVLVDDNQPVKAGQVLVRIDPRDYQARADQARAALMLAEAQAKAAQIGVPWTREVTQSGDSNASAQVASSEADYARAKLAYEQASSADLAYARANVTKRQASYELAKADLERMKPLVAKAEISQQQFDSFVAAARVAESELKAEQEHLAQAEKNVEINKASLLAAQARIEQARAGLLQARANFKQVPIRAADAASASANVAAARANQEAAELQLSYTTIVAPIDGVVTHKSVEVGQVVGPGQGLLVLVPLDDIWVTANFKETQLAKVRAGQKAEVKVDMYGRAFAGHVHSIAGATGSRLSLLPPENATGNFVKVVQRIPVKIVLDPIPPQKATLRPGMNVDATIVIR